MKGNIFNNKFHIFRIFLQHLLEERLKLCAGGSLIVTKDGNGDGSVWGSLKRQSRHINFMNDSDPSSVCEASYPSKTQNYKEDGEHNKLLKHFMNPALSYQILKSQLQGVLGKEDTVPKVKP